MPTTSKAHGLTTRRPIERFGHRRSPIDDDRFLLGVAHRDAADIEALEQSIGGFGLSIDATETQRRIAEFQMRSEYRKLSAPNASANASKPSSTRIAMS